MKTLIVKKTATIIIVIGALLTALMWILLSKERDFMAYERMESQISNAMKDVYSVSNELQRLESHEDEHSELLDNIIHSYRKSTIENVANTYTIVGSGFVSIIDKATFTIVSYKDNLYHGEYISKIGLSPQFLRDHMQGVGYINNELYYYLINSDKKYYYLAVVPYYVANRAKFLSISACVFFFLFLSLVTLISTTRVIDKYIVKNLKSIAHKLNTIRQGELNTKIELNICPEFEELSTNINLMVEHLTLQLQKESELLIEAERLANSKSKFLARMSHEIRTPLNAIIGITYFGLDNERTSEEMKDAFQGISKSSEMLLDIVNDILDMSDINTGKMELSEEAFELDKSLRNIAIIIKQKAMNNKVEFSFSFDELESISIIADKQRLYQVLMNLLNNAVKFTPSGKTIDFLVHKVSETDSEVSIQFIIKDTGIGIAEENIEYIFLPFRQADDSITRLISGTGLGLPISQHIVNLMGGEISVKSVKDVGSTFDFTITFELAAKEHKDISRQEELEVLKECDFSNIRVLLVDDVSVNRMVIVNLLSPTGIQFVEAENGKIGLDLFLKSPKDYYDLIFMDIHMPEMDGYVATELIRQSDHPDSHSIPIIAVTADTIESVAFVHRKLMDGYIKKPVNLTILQQTIIKYAKKCEGL